MTPNKTIETMLIEKGCLSKRQLERVMKLRENRPDQTVPDLLLTLGYVTEKDIATCVASRDHIPFVDLEKIKIDGKAAAMLPAAFSKSHQVVPFAFEEDQLFVAVSFPLDYDILDEAATLSGMEVKPVLALSEAVNEAVMSLHGSESRGPHLTKGDRKGAQLSFGQEEFLFKERVESAPVVRLVNEMIENAYARNSSDIHVEPGRDGITVRIRINGDLIVYATLGLEYHSPMVTRLKLMAGMDIAEKRLPQDGKHRYERGGVSTDLRISTLPSIYGEKVVLRLLGNDRDQLLMDIRKLGMDEEQIPVFERMLKVPHGIVLVTGPTGSGKSTTLYAVLSRLVKKKINVVTVEDPVEKMIDGITQVQINPKAGLTFASALRSILRQDPDVIMVGEMRDEETVSIGVRAAITGHLVLATLHTNDCASTINRLRNMGVPSYMVAASITGVVAQRLVKVLCPQCRKKVAADESQKKMIYHITGQKTETLWKSTGCSGCGGTGYVRRRAVYEIMEINEKIREMILEDTSPKEIRNEQEKRGFKPLGSYVLQMVLSGETDWEEAERIIYSAE